MRLWSAKVTELVRRAAEFGTVTGPRSVDMARVRQRKRDMVDSLITLHLDRFKASGAELIMGAGCFVAPKTIEVRLNDGGTHLLAGHRVFLNWERTPLFQKSPACWLPSLSRISRCLTSAGFQSI